MRLCGRAARVVASRDMCGGALGYGRGPGRNRVEGQPGLCIWCVLVFLYTSAHASRSTPTNGFSRCLARLIFRLPGPVPFCNPSPHPLRSLPFLLVLACLTPVQCSLLTKSQAHAYGLHVYIAKYITKPRAPGLPPSEQRQTR